MSEFQYYEFRAIDRPLTNREMAAVRQTSTRAEITPTSFVNEYHWGDYHGDPVKLMQKYYDLHVYYANWGTVHWMIRVPADQVPLEEVRAYELEGVLEISKSGQHLLLQFILEPDDGGDYEQDPSRWADRAEEIREQILSGDYRALYLMWLAGVSQEWQEFDEDEQEPPIPPGLAKLDKALKKLCQVFEVDLGLLKAAAKASGKQESAASGDLQGWIAQLSMAEKDRLLLEVCSGRAQQVSAELMAKFRRSQPKRKLADANRRAVKELRKHVEGRVEEDEDSEEWD